MTPKNPIDLNNLDEIVRELNQQEQENPTPTSPKEKNNYPNFVSGGLAYPNQQIPSLLSLKIDPPSSLNPSATDFVSKASETQTLKDLPHTSPSFLDPLRPPIVKLTEISANGDCRYLLSRFRENEIYTKTRYLLSYFHNKPPSTCLNGMTKLSLTMFLKSNGLPTDPAQLRELYLTFHSKYEGLSHKEVEEDLKSLGIYLSSQRTQHLVSAQNSHNSYYMKHTKNKTNFH